MRRMYSEKQLASIVAEVLAKDENIKWVESVKDYITYDEDEYGALVIRDFYIQNFASITTTQDDETLQDALDEKLENPTDLTDIEITFAENPTGHQLADDSKSSLTAEEIATIKNNMLYWIKKGYINAGAANVKITYYYVTEEDITIIASYVIYGANLSIDSMSQYKAVLSVQSGTYDFSLIEE